MSASDRLELLWACTYAIKDLMRNRFQDHITDQPRFLCLSSFDFMFAFLTALKLMTLQAPGWDGRRVRAELAFDDLIDRQILDLQLLAERRSQNRFRISPEETLHLKPTDGPGAGEAVPSSATATTSERGSRSGTSSGSNSSNGSPASNEADAIGKVSTPASNSNNTSGNADNGKNSGNDASNSKAGNNGRPVLDPLHDPFTRLAERLIELKSMISKELDRLPGDSSGALHPLIRGAGPANTMGPLPFASMMDAAMPNAPSDRIDQPGHEQAPVQQSVDMDTDMISSSSPPTISVAGPGIPGVAGNMTAADQHRQHQQHQLHPQQQQPPHLSPSGAMEATAPDAPFDTIAINAEPILSFADATIDYMQNLDGPGFPDLFNTPGWETYMDANMGTSSFYDSWGQMNL